MCSIVVSDRGRAGSGIAPARLRRFSNTKAILAILLYCRIANIKKIRFELKFKFLVYNKKNKKLK